MNRLQKKCVLASAGFHLLLLLILFVGPAFLSSDEKPVDLPVIDFVPLKTVDAAMMGGGNPKAKPPPAAPVARPQPPAPAPPEPAREQVKATRPAKVKHETPEPRRVRRHRVEVNTKLVSRNDTARSREKRQQAEARARAITDQRRRAAQAIGHAVTGIQSGLSGSTTIELKGPGGGGVPYANWLQAVKSVYANAWVVPDGVSDDSATTVVSVTIGRDGRVLSSSIVRSSGNPAVDQSVQATLDRVRYAAPLPDNAKESRRTVNINFNVKAKLLG